MHARQEQMRAIVGNAYLSTYVSKKGVASSGGSFSTPWMLCCTPTLPCAALRPLCPLPASSPRAAWWDKCGDMLCADVSSPPDLLLLFSAKIFFWFSASFFRFAITSACDLVMSDVVCCTAPSPTSAKRDCCRASTREPPTCMAAMANTATSATAVLPTIVPSRFK
eukprot:CAMPEP_0172013704 /NCGR_PEP_ID=MMETSP1041-20130122/9528_1 /TAXON_ID=464988 /ORGANISM="Hemiselmis andersenii, Strain CCMP439" /LENGTH=165 /DNA_ID=CAMNT_0012668395 /DNA_START=233 /DNA_END=730 /DNA_ORIENTATION=+